MQGSKKIPIVDLNEYITCKICRGYFVDATTIIECLHTFCRSCIVRYLEKNKYCPICDVQVHKTKPLLNIRPDKIIQDIVYKLVPRLFQNEMQRRREFYANHPETKPSSLEQCGEAAYQHLLTPEETICLTLSYHGSNNQPRYLRCPAAVSLGHLKKLIRAKYDLSGNHKIEILYNQDCLSSSLTLMDVAYIYLWKRKGPIELTYRIYECIKRPKLEVNDEGASNDNVNVNNNSNNNNNNNWKEVQLRISENGEMSITGIQDAGVDSSLLEIVNSDFKNESTNSDVNELKKDVRCSDKENIKEEVNLKQPGDDEKPKLPIVATNLVTCNEILVSTTQELQIVDIPIQQPLSNCASLSSSATTTTVYSTINNSKCSTKSEESLFKIVPVEKPVVVKGKDENNLTDKNLKRKINTNCDAEPPVKQSKPTILNSSMGLLNLSNNHPLKKHSKMNRNGENTKETSGKLIILENEIISCAKTNSETVFSQQNVLNKNVNNLQCNKSELPIVIPKSIMVSKQSMIRSKPTTSFTACYLPKTITTNVFKPITSSTNSVSKADVKPQLPASITVTTTVVSKAENKPVHVNSSPQQAPNTNTPNSKLVLKSKPTTPLGYKTLRDPPKSWNSQISRANLIKPHPEMKYSELKNVKPKFFKMRNNMPRYLGNPSSGVKPMYQVHVSPEKEKPSQEFSNKIEKSEIKKHSIVKIDPKTLKPISEKAPEMTSLSNHSSNNVTNQGLNTTQSLNSQPDLKINTSSVSIFNPLKLQSSPKNDRKSPKSPHSPKLKCNTSPTSSKRDKVNLTFTPPNPFVPRLASPTCTLGPSQFLYHPPYDPRVMAAAYTSLWYGQRMAQAGFPGAAGFPGPSSPGLGLDLNQQQRKSFEIMAAAATAAAAAAAHHEAQLSPKPSPISPPIPPSKSRTTCLPNVSKQSSKKPTKETRIEKSLENAVEKLTQNKTKEINSKADDAAMEKECSGTKDNKKSIDKINEKADEIKAKENKQLNNRELKLEVEQEKIPESKENTIVVEDRVPSELSCAQEDKSEPQKQELQSPVEKDQTVLTQPEEKTEQICSEEIKQPPQEQSKVTETTPEHNHIDNTSEKEVDKTEQESKLSNLNANNEMASCEQEKSADMPSEKCDVVREIIKPVENAESKTDKGKDKGESLCMNEIEVVKSGSKSENVNNNYSSEGKDSDLVQKGE